ncbi:acetyl-CoA carboxylase carboxyltransferase subunit alpha [Lacrimispora saccharolytica]|uniref:acetyl-CoA carboxylase carboxyltransferase subunit alpha n=1 Tax=Lacrimispora saccharolytica TaxID=84030 RepID=UPI00265D0C85|nr:acetyl-CoA carboxylase carboxyltransferase subunit alpha [Lacrimispora saccharolytica]MCF2655959.1 acetyl-CoA carboxylase carboxyltransferase subunit alpha [Lacrimispora saccharolytica]MCI7557373.1 acetyl-CoA carboxylase carboxyltransferase subunit alpha [Lachnospiraceae bacterium]
MENVIECPFCGRELDKDKVIKRKYVCYECGYYFRVRTNNRIKMVADRGSFEQWFEDLVESNPLSFEGYEEKLEATREKTGLTEAVTVGKCRIYGEEAVIGVCDSRFLMGSMGHVVGERITAAVERATELRLPVFIFCCSGGARMQEGIISLMQMAKTTAAIKRHSDAGLFYCTILTDPTTGGVTASFATVGDVIMAEPGALIGFAGPRVIKQTIGQDLPEGFQRAEFQVEKGFADGIVKREDLRKTIYYLIVANRPKEGVFRVRRQSEEDKRFMYTEILKELTWKSRSLTAWEKVKAVRQAIRPSAKDYMDYIFDFFVEAKGDRAYGDDQAIMGGIAMLNGQPITVIADMKGNTIEECQKRNFGMPLPEGYRKALRLMKQAEKFGRPIVSFVNTAGAYCGIEAEERGQGEAIARNLLEMSALKVPVLCIVIGEGGSGGALATAVGNEVWMMENATYSILSPEGFASILWKDASAAPKASEVMNITSQDLKRLGVVEKIIPEFGGANPNTVEAIGEYMRDEIVKFLDACEGKDWESFAEDRYNRFRKY